MSYLDTVITHGNMGQPGSFAHQRIVCADGFSMSVIAGGGAYSSPRFGPGPYTSVEIGFPSGLIGGRYAHKPDSRLLVNGQH